MTSPETDVIRKRLAQLVEESSDGALTADAVTADTASLAELGLTSLARMRLIDAIESEYGVEVDLGADGWDLVDAPDRLAAYLAAR